VATSRVSKEGEPQPLFPCKTSEVHCREESSQRYTISMLPLTVILDFAPWGGMRLCPLGTSATNCPIVPASDDSL
jgi:hypothetical protein